MKKIAASALSVGLIFGAFYGSPLQVGASNDSSPVVEAMSYSKTVTETRVYSKNQSIPSSIYYSLGGWTGTLYKGETADTGDHILVVYTGTVTCSGPCVLSAPLENEEQ
ncbi:hypothetical protein A0U40_01575 [[Bacillus] sp. KCTC 13219]|nr:hypothetical protein A0U40_01575 [[Bacillus] sp. KCTC 13219]